MSVNLVKHLAQSNAVDEILVVCDGINEEASRALKNAKINIKCLGRFKGELTRTLMRNVGYARLSKELDKFDIFHVLDYRALPLANRGVHPLIVTIHNVITDEFRMQLRTGLIGSLFKKIDHYLPQTFLEILSAIKADGIVVNSPIILSRLRELYNTFVDGKIWTIPAGFDPERFNPFTITKVDAKRSLGIDSSVNLLLHVGVASRKGLPYLLSAMDYMHKTGELNRLNILLLVLGKINTEYGDMLSRDCFSEIRKNVLELPYVREDVLPMVYRAADVFVMPSISEGWGIALIEALACGTPVIASPFVPSALAAKDLGVVHIEEEFNNSARFAKSICQVLDSQTPKVTEWNEIFTFLSLEHSWENYARAHVNFYREILKQDS